jgi:hypothetical protein
MPLFNNTTIATLLKATTNLNPTKNPGNNKKDQHGIETRKSELVKQEVLIGVTLLWLVFSITETTTTWTSTTPLPSKHWNQS